MGMLDGKVAIVTGGASGIGRAGATRMSEEGATVVVADLDRDSAQALAESLAGDGRPAMAVAVDVRDSSAVQAMVSQTLARFGRIDALFHNAMDPTLVNRHDDRLTELPDDIWRRIIDLVLTGSFLCAKYVGQAMLEAGSGSIIFTATTDALIGQAGIDGYTAAKGGVVAMTRSAAAGLSPHGVRVNAICPGFVETPHQMAFLADPQLRAEIQKLHLMPILSPEDVAEFAIFLASDRARHMTGGIHVVDSGYCAFKGGMDTRQVVGSTTGKLT
ncbi:MAG: SDR family NAD(P)-dependent oxidoreductase [Alphaproteobacteria bacterium]